MFVVQNIPQVGLQIWYLFEIQQFNRIAIISMAFSLLSIIITLIARVTEKQIINSQGYAAVEIDVTGEVIVAKSNKCMNRRDQFKNGVSDILGEQSRVIEVLRPQKIPKGLKITINILLNRISVRDKNYEKLINDAARDGTLADILKNAWELDVAPNVSNVKFLVKESEKWRKNVVPIRVMSVMSGEKLHPAAAPSNSFVANQLNPPSVIQGVSMEMVELAEMPQLDPSMHLHITKGEDDDSLDSNDGHEFPTPVTLSPMDGNVSDIQTGGFQLSDYQWPISEVNKPPI